MQVRTLTRDDIDAAADLTARVFGTEQQYTSYFELARAASLHCPWTPPALCYGIFEAGRLIAKWQLIDLSVRVLDTTLRTAGSMAVAAEPSARSADAVRTLVEAGYSGVRDAGFDLVLGIAQRGAIYQRLGARPICAEPLWELDALRIPEPRAQRFHALGEHELPWLSETYNRANAARSGSLLRTPELYSFLPRRAPELWACADGYIGVRRHTDALELREVAALREPFFDAALRELAVQARAAGVRRVFGHIPADHGLVLASAAYGARVSLEYPRASGCMAGIVDAQRFLDRLAPSLCARLQRSAFADASVRLTLHLQDLATCTLVLEAGRTRSLQLELRTSCAALVQLAFGYLPPSTVLTDIASEHEALLSALFAQPAPFMWHTDRF